MSLTNGLYNIMAPKKPAPPPYNKAAKLVMTVEVETVQLRDEESVVVRDVFTGYVEEVFPRVEVIWFTPIFFVMIVVAVDEDEQVEKLEGILEEEEVEVGSPVGSSSLSEQSTASPASGAELYGTPGRFS
ncbi:hypothetical protein C8A03DRAFT_34697 [Achaetomium macrosporum]|uniref:Uncharacterized protein n=1 Tax=Achaetomium macrosporum TaxID=79813 RepID=A0AAN7C9P1_9PEZI|nr:hypothetical protein C8A03DRAFT_34697 [Achaetomium macrosporum]